MAITKPLLPPKAGYVEVEINGTRKYKNVETGEIYGEETEKPDSEYVTYAELAAAIREGVNSVD